MYYYFKNNQKLSNIDVTTIVVSLVNQIFFGYS